MIPEHTVNALGLEIHLSIVIGDRCFPTYVGHHGILGDKKWTPEEIDGLTISASVAWIFSHEMSK